MREYKFEFRGYSTEKAKAMDAVGEFTEDYFDGEWSIECRDFAEAVEGFCVFIAKASPIYDLRLCMVVDRAFPRLLNP